MAKKKYKEKATKSDEYWVKYVSDRLDKVKGFRSVKIDRQWMINYANYKGWTQLKWDRIKKTIVWVDTDENAFYINKIYPTVRLIRGAITRSAPIWTVETLPSYTSGTKDTGVLNRYLSVLYDKLKLKMKIKEAVTFALLYSIGVFQYGYDAEANNGEGEVWVEIVDPFDFYIDPSAGEMSDARYAIKVVKRSVTELKENKNYQNTENLLGDDKFAESTYKNEMLSQVYGSDGDDDSLLVNEAWCVIDGRVHVITTCDGKLLRHEETDMEELPFVIMKADINPGEIYGEGWVKHLVPLQKAINQLHRNTLHYNDVFSKGKYIADENVRTRTITNENAQIIKVPRGARFEQMQMTPMSSTPFNQINMLERLYSEIGASHEAFMGATPAGVTAGVALETLVMNAMNNLSDILDNVQESLSQLGEKLLALGYKYYDVVKLYKDEEGIIAMGGEGTEQEGVVITNKNEIGEMSQEGIQVYKIPQMSEVKVSIEAGIAFTRQARNELLMQLRGGGDMDRKTLLENLSLNADEIERRLIEEQLKPQVIAQRVAQDQQMQRAQQMPPEGMAPLM